MSMVGMLVPLKGGIGSMFYPPEGKDYKWYILTIGGLYATYHLLREPETTIDDVTYTLRPLTARKKVWFGCGPPPRMHSLARFGLGIGSSWLIAGLGPGGLDSWNLLMKGITVLLGCTPRIPNHQFSIC